MDCHDRIYPSVGHEAQVVSDLLYDRVVVEQRAVRHEAG